MKPRKPTAAHFRGFCGDVVFFYYLVFLLLLFLLLSLSQGICDASVGIGE